MSIKIQSKFYAPRFDPLLIGSVIALLSLGLIMVTSASIVIAERRLGGPFYYTLHQAVAMVMGFFGALFICAIPIKTWFRLAAFLMVGALISLVLVLIPGVGRVVNGSARWLNVGFTSFQVSEFCKLAVVIYMSSYVVRHNEALKHKISGFIRPMLLLSLIGALLILEPDFGATVVILATSLAMLFLAGRAIVAICCIVICGCSNFRGSSDFCTLSIRASYFLFRSLGGAV